MRYMIILFGVRNSVCAAPNVLKPSRINPQMYVMNSDAMAAWSAYRTCCLGYT